jgi:glycosyltransferase involved in cell wall biosynthesis
MSPRPPGAVTEPWRVALLTPAYWPEVRRGGERIVADLARGLTGRGHSVRVLTSHPGIPTRRVEEGVLVVRSWRPPDRWLRSRELEDHLTHVPFSYLALRRGADDVAQAIFPTDALAAARWSAATGRPAVFTFTGIPDRIGFLQRRRRLEITIRAARDCAAFTVLSRAAADAAERWLGLEARVINPGVDLESFRPGGERAPEPTIFCPAAIDDPRKGLAPLLDAFRLIRGAVPEARLLLSRPSPALAAHLTRVPGVELVEQVHDPAALAAHYRRAWATALPSIGEAFGIVLAESLACGTPVVGSPHGGIPEVVDRPDVGRVARSLDPADLARSLSEAFELATSPGTAEACRVRAGDFSSERALAAYESLYAELLEARQ